MIDGGYGYGTDDYYRHEYIPLLMDSYRNFLATYDSENDLSIRLSSRCGVANWEYDNILREHDRRQTHQWQSQFPNVTFEFETYKITQGYRVIAKEFVTILSGSRTAVKNGMLQMGETTHQEFEYNYPSLLTKAKRPYVQTFKLCFEGNDKEYNYDTFIKRVDAINKFVSEAKIEVTHGVKPDSKRVQLFHWLDFPYTLSINIKASKPMMETLKIMLSIDKYTNKSY